jgi:hypothetical protein
MLTVNFGIIEALNVVKGGIVVLEVKNLLIPYETNIDGSIFIS